MVMALCFDSAYRFCASVGMWCLWYGYLDGGIGNALQDGINYNYEQIIEVLDEYIQEQSDYVCNEKIVVGVIKGAIEDMC